MAERAAFFHAPRQFLMKLFPTEESFFVVVGNGGRRKACCTATNSTNTGIALRLLITIIIVRFAIKQFESLFGRKDRIELKSRISDYVRIFKYQIRNSPISVPILFEISKDADKIVDCDKVGNALQR